MNTIEARSAVEALLKDGVGEEAGDGPQVTGPRDGKTQGDRLRFAQGPGDAGRPPAGQDRGLLRRAAYRHHEQAGGHSIDAGRDRRG